MNDWKDENNAANNNIDNADNQPKAEDNQTLVDNSTNGLDNSQIKFEPVDTKETDSKIEEAIAKQESKAEQEIKVENAKQEFMQQLEDAKDEKALANEITNTETLVTDENSVIDPKVAKENAAMINPLSMDQIKVMPVSSSATNSSNIEQKPVEVKEVKIKKATNWHRKLYFVAPLLSGLAVAGALAPIAIIKPIKAAQPNITIDDESSEGISVKSNTLKLNKDSTITLDMDASHKIINADVYINNKQLESNQYSIDSLSNTISIKAEAMTSLNVRLKLVTDAPRYTPTFDTQTSGIKNVEFSTNNIQYRQELTITCELRDGYILDQNSLSENELQLYVNDKLITDPSKVVVKQLQTNGNKYTITIQKGVIDGPVVLTGGIKKYKSTVIKKDNVESVCNGFNCSYQSIDDIQDIAYLVNGGVKPYANITVDDNGRPIPLSEENDYNIEINYRDGTYHYDLVWTNNGRQKILGPVSIEMHAETATITFDAACKQIIPFGLNGTTPYSAQTSFGEKVEDIRIIKGADLGYELNSEKCLVVKNPDEIKAGTITLQAQYHNAFKTFDVAIQTPQINITGEDEIMVDADNPVKLTASITPSEVGTVNFKWSSDDDSILSVEGHDTTSDVYASKKGSTNINAITTVTNPVTGITYTYKASKTLSSEIYKWSEAPWSLIGKVADRFYKEYYAQGATAADKEQAMRKVCASFSDIEYIEDVDPKLSEDRQIEAHLHNFIGKEKKITLHEDDPESKESALPYTMRIIGLSHDPIAEGDHAGKKALFTFDSEETFSYYKNHTGEDKRMYHYSTYNRYVFEKYTQYKYKINDKDCYGINWWFCTDNANLDGVDKHQESNYYKVLNSTNDLEHCEFDLFDSRNFNYSDKESKKIKSLSIYKQLDNYFKGTDLEHPRTNPMKKVVKKVGQNLKPVEFINGSKQGNENSKYEFTLEKYNAYCFPLTLTEINYDQSVPEGKAVKNEGKPYAFFKEAEDINELRKRLLKWNVDHNDISAYMLASPYFGKEEGYYQQTWIIKGDSSYGQLRTLETSYDYLRPSSDSGAWNTCGMIFAFCI